MERPLESIGRGLVCGFCFGFQGGTVSFVLYDIAGFRESFVLKQLQHCSIFFCFLWLC